MNRNRTFTYVEQAFFVRWWRQQDAATRALVKTLVKEGRPAAHALPLMTGVAGVGSGPFDVNNLDETIQDDPNLEDYNVKSRVDGFVAAALAQANMTRGKNIMMTMGSDFQYEDLLFGCREDALTWFYNLDRLIQHVNEDGRIKVFYSTPSRYVEAKQKETMVKWPLKEDDFFPYADGPHKFWTGYFTSRPTLKRYIRDTSAFFQVAKQITALAESGTQGLEHLAEALGVAQHHDAVSGTAKQHVTFDYAKRLARGRTALSEEGESLAYPEVSKALKTHMGKASVQDFTLCELRNVSLCAPTQAVGRSTNRPGSTERCGSWHLWTAG
eukprot:g13162.t1